jgi:hypothetical protein
MTKETCEGRLSDASGAHGPRPLTYAMWSQTPIFASTFEQWVNGVLIPSRTLLASTSRDHVFSVT